MDPAIAWFQEEQEGPSKRLWLGIWETIQEMEQQQMLQQQQLNQQQLNQQQIQLTQSQLIHNPLPPPQQFINNQQKPQMPAVITDSKDNHLLLLLKINR